MGNEQSSQTQQSFVKTSPQELKKMIFQSITNKRLQLDESEENIEKLQYLISHLDEFDFEQLLLGMRILMRLRQMQNYNGRDTNNLQDGFETGQIKNQSHQFRYIRQYQGYNQLTCDFLKPITNLHLINLTTLYLDHNKISTDGCYYLTKPKLQSLQTLDLTSNKIDDEGCRTLAAGGNWPQLRTFFICQNKLSVKGFLYLSKAQWPRLIYLKATKNNFEPSQKLAETKFRTETIGFKIQLQ